MLLKLPSVRTLIILEFVFWITWWIKIGILRWISSSYGPAKTSYFPYEIDPSTFYFKIVYIVYDIHETSWCLPEFHWLVAVFKYSNLRYWSVTMTFIFSLQTTRDKRNMFVLWKFPSRWKKLSHLKSVKNKIKFSLSLLVIAFWCMNWLNCKISTSLVDFNHRPLVGIIFLYGGCHEFLIVTKKNLILIATKLF